MLFELRQYRVQPGRRDDWVRVMEDQIIPFQSSLGMVIVGSFVAEEDPDLYVWIRRFDSEDERVRQYEAVYQSDHWKTNLAPLANELLEREKMVITRLLPTAASDLK